jgi:hypothetical protein
MTDAIPAPMAPEGQQFSIGRAFSMTFGVLGRNLKAMAPIALVVNVVQSGIDYLLSGDQLGSGGLGNSILGVFAYALIIAPVSYATFQDLRGVRLDTAAMMSGGFNQVGRVIGASFAVVFVMAVPALIAGFMWAVVTGAMGLFFGAAAVILILYILVLSFVVVPVLVVEDVRFFSSFRRASDLSRGRRWGLLGLLLVCGLLVVAVGAVIYAIVAFTAAAPVLALVAIIPLSALYSVVAAILPVVVYYLLRAEKEGIGIEDIVKVFD